MTRTSNSTTLKNGVALTYVHHSIRYSLHKLYTKKHGKVRNKKGKKIKHTETVKPAFEVQRVFVQISMYNVQFKASKTVNDSSNDEDEPGRAHV